MRTVTLLLALCCVACLTGCQTLRQIASLKELRFALTGVESSRLAGVDLGAIRTVNDVSAVDMLRLGNAIARNELPLDFTLVVSATNPETNSVDARMVSLDWTLLLDDRETVSGRTESEVLIAPGATAAIPTLVSINLLEFFDSNLPDLIDLALAVSGGGGPTRVKLQATPTVTTVLGPISYPQPITIVSKDVGG